MINRRGEAGWQLKRDINLREALFFTITINVRIIFIVELQVYFLFLIEIYFGIQCKFKAYNMFI